MTTGVVSVAARVGGGKSVRPGSVVVIGRDTSIFVGTCRVMMGKAGVKKFKLSLKKSSRFQLFKFFQLLTSFELIFTPTRNSVTIH